MKVLHVNQIARFMGGVERILFDTARSLSLEGAEQALLFEEGSADVRLLSAFKEAGKEIDLAKRFKPDVILVHRVSPEVLAELLKVAPTVRMVHDHDLVCLRRHKYYPVSKTICSNPAGVSCLLHGCFVQPSLKGAFPFKFASLTKKLNEIRVNRNVSNLIVGSRWMRESLIKNGFDARQISIVPPVPASLDDVLLAPKETKPADPIFLYVGQIIRGKGIDLLLHALAALNGEWRAVFVGDGNFIPEAHRLIDELDLTEKVHLLGQVEHDDLDELYRAALAVVVPSRWPEPFGMVGIEAMARSRPVVGFSAGGISDWLDNEITGLLVGESDIVGLTFALQKLLDSPSYARELGLEGRRRVEQDFSHAGYVAAIKSILEQASETRSINVCR